MNISIEHPLTERNALYILQGIARDSRIAMYAEDNEAMHELTKEANVILLLLAKQGCKVFEQPFLAYSDVFQFKKNISNFLIKIFTEKKEEHEKKREPEPPLASID